MRGQPPREAEHVEAALSGQMELEVSSTLVDVAATVPVRLSAGVASPKHSEMDEVEVATRARAPAARPGSREGSERIPCEPVMCLLASHVVQQFVLIASSQPNSLRRTLSKGVQRGGMMAYAEDEALKELRHCWACVCVQDQNRKRTWAETWYAKAARKPRMEAMPRSDGAREEKQGGRKPKRALDASRAS